jgi:heme-degrading monooxygenase HmoA
VITEHALLYVKPGDEARFEEVFPEAADLMSQTPGFCGLTISRSVANVGEYLLLVRWMTVEDHIRGWRNSQQFLEWSLLLHKYYDPFPTVQHYEEMLIIFP